MIIMATQCSPMSDPTMTVPGQMDMPPPKPNSEAFHRDYIQQGCGDEPENGEID